MELNCPECNTPMERTHGREHTKFECPQCHHIIRQKVGKKKMHAIRLYQYQKQIADKRGGVQIVVDTALAEDEE